MRQFIGLRNCFTLIYATEIPASLDERKTMYAISHLLHLAQIGEISH